MPGPAPSRPMVETALPPFSIRSRIGALSMDLNCRCCPAAAVPVRIKIPEPMTAPTPRPIRLHGPSVLRNRRSGDSEAAISASIPRVRSSLFKTGYRLRTCWPLGICLTFFLLEPRATVEGRLAFGAAFLRAARFSFLRSSVDSIFLVFIVSFIVRPLSGPHTSPLVSLIRRGRKRQQSSHPRHRLPGGRWSLSHIWGALLLYLLTPGVWGPGAPPASPHGVWAAEPSGLA